MTVNYYSPETIKESGREAFFNNIKLEDCPISPITHANAIHYWKFGWHDASNNSCKGENCRAIRGAGHSEQCVKEHESQYNENFIEHPKNNTTYADVKKNYYECREITYRLVFTTPGNVLIYELFNEVE